MFLLVSAAIFTFVVGFVCPPLWILTFLSVRAIVRLGRNVHAEAYDAAELQRTKVYDSWTR